MGKFITVIDYGLGNLKSVSKGLETVGAQVKVSNKAEDIASAGALVLPGVGAFQRAMANLNELGIVADICKAIKKGKPFLGICLGLQILFTESEEHGKHKGLDVIKGKVVKFSAGVKIPHMGWNRVKQTKDPSFAKASEGGRRPKTEDLFAGVADEAYFYFVHSYFVVPEDKNAIVGMTKYGQEFASAVNQDNVWGVQFHPEKSTNLGLTILKNFVSLC